MLIPDLDPFIRNDQRALRLYLLFGAGVIGAGLALVGLSFLPGFGGKDGITDTALKLGGGFVGTLSAFPMREWMARRDRLVTLASVKEMVVRLSAAPAEHEAELKRLNELAWRLLEKGTLG